MAQIIPKGIEVPTRYSDQSIGYSIKTMDDKVYSSFKVANKSTVPNTFSATVIAPSNGGWIIWGLENSDMWLDTIEPQITIPDFKQTLSNLIEMINNLFMPLPTFEIKNQVDTQVFDDKVNELSQSVTEQLADELSKNLELNKQLVTQMDDLTAKYNKLQFISDNVVEQTNLENLRIAFTEFMNSKLSSNTDSLLSSEMQTESIINSISKLRKRDEQKAFDAVSKLLNTLENL